MAEIRYAHTATFLQNGEVFVAGGSNGKGSFYITETTNSAELWDPSTQTRTSTGNLNISRAGESLTVLQNGQALVAGGSQSTKNSSGFVILATAELYRP